ncbi:site-2 protease family protein [Actinopolyspora halophila]|uniref:site-2 protease family protein n=1 Tax=Actinopolyspora halophila TaxID=1850 RepID=UPI000380711E|nr:site-2 protease family protein [Actinopolyspora halophila]
MTGTIPLGRVAGIRLGLHWSVAGIVGLIVFVLGSYWLPNTFPGHAAFFYWLSGGVAALLLVTSVLVHELAHALVAVRRGVPVDGITLWLLGGVSRLRGEAPNPRVDLLIAVVGPVASGLLAGVFAGLSWALVALQAGQLSVAVTSYLSALNLVVAVFNLLPAAPLDGGRILRAAIWSRTGDRFKAAVWATRTGATLGFLLIAYGFYNLVTRGFEGIWAVLIGLFVIRAAGAEKQQAQVSAALAGVRIEDVIGLGLAPIGAESPVRTALTVSGMHGNAALAVTDTTGRTEGVVLPEQLRAVPIPDQERTTVRQLARPVSEFESATVGEALTTVLTRLRSPGNSSIPVFENERPVGMVLGTELDRIVTERMTRPRTRTVPGETVAPPGAEPPADWWYPGQGHRR